MSVVAASLQKKTWRTKTPCFTTLRLRRPVMSRASPSAESARTWLNGAVAASALFFFKQKTAYELTYGDWSSDVCSSDLGEDRQPLEVAEGGDPGEREVVRNDLRALVEAAVGVHRHASGEQLGQALRRAAGSAHQVERAALAEERPELAQRLGEERCELVVARLAEDVGELLGAHGAQLGVRPRAVRAVAIGQAPRDREVARRAGALAQRREP